MRIIFIGIPCTFYNISKEIGNNLLLIHDGSSWKYVTISDGLYTVDSFDRELSAQLRKIGLPFRAIRFDVDERTGKILINFRKAKGGNPFKISIRNYNKDMLGFDSEVNLPKSRRDPKNPTKLIYDDFAKGDKPAMFKPFEYYFVHCDLVDTNELLYNGKRSDILARIPVKECKFGELNPYYLTEVGDRKCSEKINKIKLWITNEKDELIDFNGANIQYELLFRCENS